MKIRNGFVSNSSSSSFLIYGADIDTSIADELEEKAKKEGLDLVWGPEGDTAYIGLSWDAIGDDETGRQFKTRIETACKKLIGDTVTCSTHEDAWYNG